MNRKKSSVWVRLFILLLAACAFIALVAAAREKLPDDAHRKFVPAGGSITFWSPDDKFAVTLDKVDSTVPELSFRRGSEIHRQTVTWFFGGEYELRLGGGNYLIHFSPEEGGTNVFYPHMLRAKASE